jgi:hypothetical protein
MKKWVKVGSLFMVMFLFCTGISLAGNIGDKGISPLVVAHNGNGPGDGTGNGGSGPGDGTGNGPGTCSHNGNGSGTGPGDGTGSGAPDGAGSCPR